MAKKKHSPMKATRRYASRLVAAMPLVVPSVVAAVASVATTVELRRLNGAAMPWDNATDHTPSEDYSSASNGQTAPRKRAAKKTRASA